MSRRRAAVNPRTSAAAIAEPNTSRSTYEQVAGAGLLGERERHPQRGAGDQQAGHREYPAGAAVPGEVAATQARDELERPDQHVERGADDVHHQRGGEPREPARRPG